MKYCATLKHMLTVNLGALSFYTIPRRNLVNYSTVMYCKAVSHPCTQCPFLCLYWHDHDCSDAESIALIWLPIVCVLFVFSSPIGFSGGTKWFTRVYNFY